MIEAEVTPGKQWRVSVSEVARLKRDGLPPIPRQLPPEPGESRRQFRRPRRYKRRAVQRFFSHCRRRPVGRSSRNLMGSASRQGNNAPSRKPNLSEALLLDRADMFDFSDAITERVATWRRR